MQWQDPDRTAFDRRNSNGTSDGIKIFDTQSERFTQPKTCADDQPD